MDYVLRVLLLLVLICAGLVLYEVWRKIHGVDFGKIQNDVEDIKKEFSVPQSAEISDCESQLERCLSCCSTCKIKDTCNGNPTCYDCLKINPDRAKNFDCCAGCENKDDCTCPNSRCEVCHNWQNTQKDDKK